MVELVGGVPSCDAGTGAGSPHGPVGNLDGWEIEIGGRFLGPQNFRVCSGWVPFFPGTRKKVTGVLSSVTDNSLKKFTMPVTR